ncbi:MAG: zinc-dependent peptidase [Burkholderiaceae bacterium]|nr:zinc-dependent peptidase [Burkholderiaceae bacterium]
MVMALLRRWRAHREARVLARRAIPEALWRLTLARLPFLAARPAGDLAELRRLASLFLDQKEFSGAGGLVVDDAIALCIAAQAVLPVLRFGLAPYAGFVGIVVHPDEVVARRETMDDDGIVHEWDEVLAGEAMAGGPVMLSWRDVAESGESADWGYNVVIHEFAHVLDMGDGEADGVPPLASAAEREAWVAVMAPAYERFCAEVDSGAETLLDPYGATGVDEFFAVASESFFVTPKAMRAEHPALYGLLARYYRQDPAVFGGP